jgi:pimeloyl-ACP methyl ester carboxylesterase
MNIWGEYDKVVPRAGAQSVCMVVRKCKLLVVEDVGHIPQEETPEKIIPLLRDFLHAR